MVKFKMEILWCGLVNYRWLNVNAEGLLETLGKKV